MIEVTEHLTDEPGSAATREEARPVSTDRAAKRLGSRGQAMMEYVLLTIACVIGLLGFSVIFQRAIRGYLEGIYFFVSLPIP